MNGVAVLICLFGIHQILMDECNFFYKQLNCQIICSKLESIFIQFYKFQIDCEPTLN